MSETLQDNIIAALADLTTTMRLINENVSQRLKEIKKIEARLNLIEDKCNRIQKQIQYLNEQINKD